MYYISLKMFIFMILCPVGVFTGGTFQNRRFSPYGKTWNSIEK